MVSSWPADFDPTSILPYQGERGMSILPGTEMYVVESMTNDGLALYSGEIGLPEV